MPERKMPQRPPKLRQLGDWPPTCPPNSDEVWEISAPSKNSLCWSIVLSYVISMKKENLHQQFQLLLGSDAEMREVMQKKKISPHAIEEVSIKNQVNKFNPFKNRHAFYFNSKIIEISRIFDLRLNRSANNVRRDVPWGNTRKLEAASRMLKCQIRVYETDESGNKTFRCYPEDRSVPCGNGELVIFQHSGVAVTENIKDVFAFGMSIDHTLPLRKDALRDRLKVAKLNEGDIHSIMKDFQYNTNFLYFLLKTSKQNVIPILYKSPYVVEKLADVGFDIDPFCLEHPEGPSVFYYCMHPDAYKSLITLYGYASNNCYKTDETTRNPGTEILSALQSVSDLIQRDLTLSNDSRRLRDNEVMIGLEILHFNEYQREVVQSILDLKKPTENSEHITEKIICSIFRHYGKHFLFEAMQSKNDVAYGNFVQCAWYYENLDSFTCLQFFDIILKLNVSDRVTEAMMSLFLTILGYNYLPKCVHSMKTPCDLSKERCGLSFVAFNNRRHFLQHANDLIVDLESNPSKDKEKSRAKTGVDRIRTKLGCFPELKDQFSITRLKVSMKSALDVSLETSGIKGVLTIERALQVVGETLCPSSSGECILSCLLSACIPQDLTNQLITIRNTIFSHSKSALVHGRMDLEESSLYARLQKLLNKLNEAFEIVYHTQEYRLYLMLLERSTGDAENFSTGVWGKLKAGRDIITAERNNLYQTNKKRYVLLVDSVLIFFLEKVNRDEYKKAGKYGEIAALEYLYNSLPTTLDERNQLLDAIKDMKVLAGHSVLSDDDKVNLSSLLSKQQKIISDAFGYTNSRSFELSNLNNLKSFHDGVKSHCVFSAGEMVTIKTVVKDLLEKSKKAKVELQTLLANNSLSQNELSELLNVVIMTDKQRQNMAMNFTKNRKKAFDILNKVRDVDINDILQGSADDLLVYLKKEELCKPMALTRFPGSIESKMSKYLSWRAVFLLNRINHLKKILIDEDDEIYGLWKWGRSKGIQKHVRFLMRARYIKERDVRASLEMLLFDCHNVLPGHDGLAGLWTKLNKLFTDIDLRDVLSHGNTVLQRIGELLDPEDLPSELIDKMLELIEDGDAVRALLTLYEKKKPSNRAELEKFVEESKDCSKIKECKKWETYLKIFPLK